MNDIKETPPATTMTGRSRPGRLALGALLAALVTLASMLVGSPASAASTCGNQVNVRVSIYYRSCSDNVGPGWLRSAVVFQNNHGSPVLLVGQEAISVDGGTWTGRPPEDWWIPAGQSRSAEPDPQWSCVKGHSYRLGFRVLDSNGYWGPMSAAPARVCQ